MGKVFVNVTMSLDGFIAPPDPGQDEAARQAWMQQWMQLQQCLLRQKFFREKLKIGEGGETGADNTHFEATFARTGATVMGKRMFDAGEHAWPEDAPFGTPVFVVTHTVRPPWPRKGGTTFHFVNDGIESALRQARAVAGERDVRIGGGGDLIGQFLAAGLVDELEITIAPMLLATGVRMFDGVDMRRIAFDPLPAVPSPQVTHVRYAVRRL